MVHLWMYGICVCVCVCVCVCMYVCMFFLLLHRACCYNYCLTQLMHLHLKLYYRHTATYRYNDVHISTVHCIAAG